MRLTHALVVLAGFFCHILHQTSFRLSESAPVAESGGTTNGLTNVSWPSLITKLHVFYGACFAFSYHQVYKVFWGFCMYNDGTDCEALGRRAQGLFSLASAAYIALSRPIADAMTGWEN
ncbi:hypothetical protein PG985_014717 [Apiospora marii]|uniref:Uncharacterized protein n=1 Tax=Apiospora marii TaxID=335849 RepID=A0ABR1R459_9PEZI